MEGEGEGWRVREGRMEVRGGNGEGGDGGVEGERVTGRRGVDEEREGGKAGME